MPTVITCPSGLTGRIRGMKVQEERVLTDTTKLDWGKVLKWDQFLALLMIRVQTYGAQYAFGVGCGGCSTPTSDS
jgi:hypothetical protein